MVKMAPHIHDLAAGPTGLSEGAMTADRPA